MCGNGIIEEGEQCDDGNTEGGDGCSDICLEESSHVCEHKTAPESEWSDDLTASKVDSYCEELSGSVANAQIAAASFSAIATGSLGVTSLMRGSLGAGFFMLANTFQIIRCIPLVNSGMNSVVKNFFFDEFSTYSLNFPFL